MQHLYEELMGRMSDVLKPVSSAHEFKQERVKRRTYKFNPFVTISREPGSGGKYISKKLAKLMGFRHYDKKLIEEVAKSVNRREALIRTIDEKGRSFIQDLVHSLFDPDYISDAKYIKKLCNVVLAISEKGNAVILGRGANFYTLGEHGLHVRISAPYPVRVQRARKHDRLSEKKAREVIRKVDYDRKSFVSQYFGKNISSANYYDLVINTTYLDVDETAQIILKAFKLKFPGYFRHFKYLQRRKKGS